MSTDYAQISPRTLVVDVGGGIELSPRGDSMHSIERGIIPLIVAKWRINETSLCGGSCLRMIN